MRDQYYRTAEALIIMYSITDRSSFNDVETMHQAILRTKDVDEFPVIILGNKADLEHDRVVSTQEGEQLAKKLKCFFMESSCKARFNIDESMNELLRHAVTYAGQEIKVVIVGGLCLKEIVPAQIL